MKKPTEPAPISQEAQQQAEKDASMEKLKQYGGNIVTVILLVLAGYFGWTYWQNKGVTVDTVAADQFTSIQNLSNQVATARANPNADDELVALLAESEKQLTMNIDELVASHGDSIYAWQALMIKASEQMNDNNFAASAESLQQALQVPVIDAGLKAMTELRYAQALFADGQLDEAKNIVNVQMPKAFEASQQELIGDIAVQQDDKKTAENAYQNAWELLKERDENRSVLLLKMESLGMVVEPIEQKSLLVSQTSNTLEKVENLVQNQN